MCQVMCSDVFQLKPVAKGFYIHVEIILPFDFQIRAPIRLFCSQQFGF